MELSFLPATKAGLNLWSFFCLIGLPVVACVIAYLRGRKARINAAFVLKYVYSGAAFPTFLLLSTALVREENLILLSDVTLYVSIAGIGDLIVVVASLFE